MAPSGRRCAKRSRTEALLEALMLRINAMDQAIVSLKSQPPDVSRGLAERPRRAGGPPREAFPIGLTRACGQGRHKGELQGLAVSDQGIQGNQDSSHLLVAPEALTLAPDAPVQVMVPPVIANALVPSFGVAPGATAPVAGGSGQVTVQSTTAASGVVYNVGSGMAIG
ncbi:hypothetical protein NDU88_004231 [Pleurodeles waltl]|uniref:Uncharacterized protein n=1 Tax=Pleurodeles waltl TaxID=8319 RepID=A0AAV7L0S6_PLEWA|nr:hypothetical protein NDU88_004231 [Pleurodeles waltl]